MTIMLYHDQNLAYMNRAFPLCSHSTKLCGISMQEGHLGVQAERLLYGEVWNYTASVLASHIIR